MLERLKAVARKAYKLTSKSNGNCIYLNYSIVIDIFAKLKKECREIYLSRSEKVISVLSKNIEIALEEKAKAEIQILKIKEIIEEDYRISKEAIKNPKPWRLLSSQNNIEEEKDEDIPEEVDGNLHMLDRKSVV